MKRTLIISLAIIGSIFIEQIQGQNFNLANLESQIDSLIPSTVKDTTPGLVVGIVQNGQLIFSKGYGLANISYQIPNDPKMVYNIGSVSKQFLGYAFAILHNKGDLNIDDTVNKYFDEWPEFEHPVKIRHLLTHTSGYREAYTPSVLAGRMIGVDRLSREECLEVVRRQPKLEFTPGSRHTYNSTAWVILAEILAKVTGEPADQWVESNILIPLGMKDTQIESAVGEAIKNAAESYDYHKDHGYINQKSNRAFFGAADIYTSINDLAKWLNNFSKIQVGDEKVMSLFLDPYILSDGINSEYALGIENNQYRGLKRYQHNGGHESFITQLTYYPEHQTGIIIISNYGSKAIVRSNTIAELLLGSHMNAPESYDDQKIEMEEERLKAYAGLYIASTFNDAIELSFDDGRLMKDGRDQLIPVESNTFKINGSNEYYKFKYSPERMYRLTRVRSNAKRTYQQVESGDFSDFDLDVYSGDYWSKELETVYHLEVKNQELYVQHRWIGEIKLNLVIPDLFFTNYGFSIKFNRNQKREIIGFDINSSRTLNMTFDLMD